MARYVTIPGPVELLDPNTDAPIVNVEGAARSVSFADTIRALVLDQRVQERFDTYALNDLRRKLTRSAPGDVVEIADAEQEALSKACLEKPTFHPALRFCGEAHFRAITDAPSKDPRPKVEKEK
jgi:hypothetical protein